MNHIFKEGEGRNKNTLLLLHGVGGNERDLFPVAEKIDKTASILSVRGKVKENGEHLFVKRLQGGHFEEEDVIYRTKELYEFINRAAFEHGFDRKHVIAVGFSNGAMIAGSLLYHYEDALRGAILFHPTVPRKGIVLPKMSRLPIFITAGKNDAMNPPEETEYLYRDFIHSGADVEIHWGDWGEDLTNEEIALAVKWYNKQIKKVRK